MIRYADHFVVLTKTKRDAEQLDFELSSILSRRNLEFSAYKTKILDVVTGFYFLVLNIRLAKFFRRKYLVIHTFNNDGKSSFFRSQCMVSIATPSKKSFAKVKVTLKDLFIHYAGPSPAQLVVKANQEIRGGGVLFK